jgi:hypothetical protein
MVDFLRRHELIGPAWVDGRWVDLDLEARRRRDASAVRVRVLSSAPMDAAAVAALDAQEWLAETSRDPVSGQVRVVFGPGAFVTVGVLAQVVLHELVRVVQCDLNVDPQDPARELEATSTRARLYGMDWQRYLLLDAHDERGEVLIWSDQVRLSELRDKQGRAVGVAFLTVDDDGFTVAHDLARSGFDVTHETGSGVERLRWAAS